ncbi:hypothetical protein SAMN04488134_10525 [Amphibacillus marinus]|uniref:Permuted papain-like amidase enzyme, YaeF/YiiX, C92 family n=1 Tax=Amphibacillus marinus TaxID=872970 RepID=A0A1H8MWD7_9BACI|nr:hypothetical protein [Amphibacillus marinus]SEO21599.1 hypothetical protein SAMN04488134_10525 [Amphibacillus marinus]
MKKKTVYLLFLSTGTILARTIDFYTKTSLNHVSIALDQELDFVYSFGRKRPNNPFIGGFIKENLNLPFFNRSSCAVYQLKVTEEEYDQLVEQIMIMESHKHLYRYNFLGLLGVMMNKELQRDNAYFCSQFVATMLQECGVYDGDKPPGLIRPQDLRDWRELRLVYQGQLKNYPNFIYQPEQAEARSLRRSFLSLFHL